MSHCRLVSFCCFLSKKVALNALEKPAVGIVAGNDALALSHDKGSMAFEIPWFLLRSLVPSVRQARCGKPMGHLDAS